MKNPFKLPWSRNLYQNHRKTILVVQALLFAALGYLIARGFSGSPSAEPASDDPTGTIAKAESGPTLWTCSMHPQIRQPNSGSCPICGMDLIPVQTQAGGLRTLTVSPETRALMNVATTPVMRKYVTHEIPMVGKVDYDETKKGYIAAWVPGRLDDLYVDYTGIHVNKGDHMVYIYSPELYSAQEELIGALKHRGERSPTNTTRLIQPIDLVEASREKLRLLGLSEAQIKEIETQNKPSDHLTINAPVSGIVIEKLKQEGDYVKTGERIYTVADLNQLWVHLDAYETDLLWIRYGQDVTITTEAYPGEKFHGRISFIQPVLNDKTRTVKVRVNVPNPEGKLKPDMFVHATVKPNVAAGGRVMDPNLAGKWISPMHPEIVKDEPGKCDVCGMELVRAESLGYVTPSTDEQQAPLVIPYSAALVTGTRAIVYVELPVMPSGIETAFQGVSAALEAGGVEQIRSAFAVFSNVLDRPYDQPATAYARELWNGFADRLAKHALVGKRVQSQGRAAEIFAPLESIMTEVKEEFGPIGQPTFEGREIVLGPRAGNYYLVRHGLQEGELVVTQGNFKVDAEIQIQAKPSMMTPEGGGGGGHDHGGDGSAKKAGEDEHAGHKMAFPASFHNQIVELQAAYEEVAQAVEKADLGQITAAFGGFRKVLGQVDGSVLTGHPRMQWKEFQMLLENDAVEGQDVKQMAEADRVFLLLKGHMRRLREQLEIQPDQQPQIEPITVPQEFQGELAAVWERYLAIQKELAADEFSKVKEALVSLETSVTAVDDAPISDRARQVWQKEKSDLQNIIGQLKKADDIKKLRSVFKPLSEEIGVLAKTFGFGEAGPIYELHCPMAFRDKGAIWYQDNEQVRNPYFGAAMLKCADRVNEVIHDEPAVSGDDKTHLEHTNP